MKKIHSTIAALTFGVLSFAAVSISADEIKEKNVMVQIHKLHDADTKVDIDVNGNAEVFNLPELSIGETKNIVTESGNTIDVSRTDEGYTVTIDGEEISLPNAGSEMSANIVKQMMPLHTSAKDEIQVIGDLTDEQIAIIKDGFAAAGVNKEIKFTKGHEMRFISIDDKDGNFEFEFNGEGTTDLNTWVTEDGQHNQIKIIKMGDKEKHMEVKSEFIVIDKVEEDSDN
jgi:hypothetical protein